MWIEKRTRRWPTTFSEMSPPQDQTDIEIFQGVGKKLIQEFNW